MPIFSGFPAGGAGDLNFSVVAYASEDDLPVTAAENTIAVITDTAISSYVFSATEPETPDEGMVWFYVGTASNVEFNALKKNGIQVYPLSAKQYVSGALVDVEAKSYQNGEWVEWWDGSLFDHGKLYESITGGWGSSGVVYSGFTIKAATIGESIYLETGSSGNIMSIAMTKNKINVSNKTKLYADFTEVSRANAIVLGIAKSRELSASGVVVSSTLLNSKGIAEVVLPVDGGEYYVYVYASSAGSAASTATTARTTKIWLE